MKCAQDRDGGDVTGAARMGAAPWQLAMLSAGLLLLEIGVGEFGDDDLATKSFKIEEDHVVRAYELFKLINGQRQAWQQGDSGSGGEGALAGHELTLTQMRAQALSGAAPPTAQQYSVFAPTQQGPDPIDPGRASSPGLSADAVGGDAPPGRCARSCKLPTDADVPAMEYGYGPGGAQAQRGDTTHKVIMSDRAVMRATLLRGEPVVYGVDVTGALSVRGPPKGECKRPKMSLKIAHWEQVMQAGLSQYRIGEFVPASLARVPFRAGKSYGRRGAQD